MIVAKITADNLKFDTLSHFLMCQLNSFHRRSRSQIAITLPASSRPGSAAGKKTSSKGT